MNAQNLLEKIGQMSATERFDMIYGPHKKFIEETLHCKILTLDAENYETAEEISTCYMVKDPRLGMTFLAVFQSTCEHIQEQ
jgi:hypothetical protein